MCWRRSSCDQRQPNQFEDVWRRVAYSHDMLLLAYRCKKRVCYVSYVWPCCLLHCCCCLTACVSWCGLEANIGVLPLLVLPDNKQCCQRSKPVAARPPAPLCPAYPAQLLSALPPCCCSSASPSTGASIFCEVMPSSTSRCTGCCIASAPASTLRRAGGRRCENIDVATSDTQRTATVHRLSAARPGA